MKELPVEVETYHSGVSRTDGCGIDALPNTRSTGRLKGVRLRIRLYRDGSVGLELVTDEYQHGVPRYDLLAVPGVAERLEGGS